jgi:glycosyltransferase involved in cell wall biosynthesis
MNIAFIVPYVPNPIRTRSYNLITHLSKLGHKVDVFTVGSSYADREDANSLKSRCANVFYFHQPLWRSLTNSLGASFSGKPLQSVYSWQPELGDFLTELFTENSNFQYNVIHVEHLRGSRYGVLVKSKFPNIPVVWDSVDCISHLFEQASVQSKDLFGKFVTRFELERTRKMEGNLLGHFNHVIVTSPVDRIALLNLRRNGKKLAPLSILSNGVDQDFFHPNPEIDRDSKTLIFSGKMSYHANISMVKYLVSEIMPRIWNTLPGTKLLIVGKDPTPDIIDLGKNPLITVTGTVDDIRPFLWHATISVVPLLYGAGIQNKILEAMATGTPVVTSFKALSALKVQAGNELLAAKDSDEFSRAVLQLMEDRNLQRKVGAAGVSYIKNHHDWTTITSRLLKIYQQTINKNRRSP